MSKSFCSGCQYWVLYRDKLYQSGYDASNKFHYCKKYNEYSLKQRKRLCNGAHWKGLENEMVLT